jgi:molybdopterin-binding protein
MRKQTNVNLFLVLVWCVMMPALTIRAQGLDLVPQQEANNKSQPSPVTVTRLLSMSAVSQTLEEWFDNYAESEQVALSHRTNVGGYDALVFLASVEGMLQRGVVVDLGNGEVIMHLTTNRKASEVELAQGASQFVADALQSSAASSTDNLACNCVLWARSQVPSLPSGLTSYSQKLAVINHRFPRVGAVAVINVPSGPTSANGHLAVVRGVAINHDGSLQLTLQEANWTSCQITWRSGTPASLNIQGYFDPAYPAGATSPRLDLASPASGTSGRQFYTTASGVTFEANSAQAIILGGWCDSFYKCVVPNNVMTNRSSASLRIPLTMGVGNYMLYIFNSNSGKTSNGKPITIN